MTLGQTNIFYRTQKVLSIKNKKQPERLHFISFCSSRGTVQIMKRQVTDWGENLQYTYLEKETLKKDVVNTHGKKTNNLIKNKQKTRIDINEWLTST